MNDESLESRIQSYLEKAVHLPADDRESFLREQCPESLREAVRDRLHEADFDTQSINVAPTDAWKQRQDADKAADDIWDEGTFVREERRASSLREEAAPSIEGYVIEERIGRGGMGAVYRARHTATARTVALKVVRPDRIEHSSDEEREEAIERFRTEALAAARLEHEGIVTVYAVGESHGVHYYSMRFVDGQSLSELVQSGPLPPKQAAKLTEEASRALHEAHGSGVLHRDIKPQNIMVDAKTGRALVADFGLAKLAEGDSSATKSGDVFGSPPYMSPEQAIDASRVSATSDTYGLGATLYHILTGRPPFQGSSALQTLKLVIDQEPVAPRELNPEIDRDLETICLKSLAKEPARRYASAEALADDLGRYFRDEPIHARPASRVERFRKFARRNRGLVWGVGLAIASLLVGLAATSASAYWAIREAGAAKIAQGKAEDATRRAMTSSIESLTQAGKLASQRGRWDVARDNYDRAIKSIDENAALIDDAEAIQSSLRIERIKTLLATFEARTARDEAERLMATSAAQTHEAEVLMLRGAADATQFIRSDKGLTYFQRALATGGLDAADENYARAVLAKDVDAGIRHAEACLKADPFRQDAHNLLIVLYGMKGQRKKVYDRLRSLQAMFPEDPNYVFLESLLKTLDGEFKQADETLLLAKDRLSDEQLQAARRDVKVLAALVSQLEDAFTGTGNYFGMIAAWRQADKLAVLLGRHGDAEGRLIPLAGVNGYPAMQPLVTAAKNFVLSLVTFQYSAARKQLGEVLEQFPIHELYLLHGKLSFKIANGRKENEAKRPELLQADRSFRAAANLPQFISAMPPMANMDGLAVETELLYWGMVTEGEDHDRLKRHAQKNVRELIAIAADPNHRWNRWVLDQSHMVVIGATGTGHHGLARDMAKIWIEDQPDSAVAYEWLALVEQRSQNWAAALRASSRALELEPGRQQAMKTRAKALQALRGIIHAADDAKNGANVGAEELQVQPSAEPPEN